MRLTLFYHVFLSFIISMKIKMLPPAILCAFAVAISPASYAARNNITPGQVWNDTSGRHINAHGGCVQYLDGTYYWFGEDRTGYDSNGVSCYTSTDLYNWSRKGLVFKASQAIDPETGKCTLERPKVIFNDNTGKWVMYIHWENGEGYGEARVCVAVADKIDGDYQFVSTFRPNNHDSRDQTIFKDTDGKAYHFASTDMNTNMNLALLSADYLSTENSPVTETKILMGLRYEAPAIIKAGDTYFGVFSGCTGWDPNPGHSATATEIMGYWEPGRNFAIDNGAATTYRSQSTYIFKVADKEGAYVYMGDRWNSSDVGGKSEYVWLPLSLRSGAPTVKWHDSWDISVFDDCDRFKRIAAPADGAVVRILDKYSDRWISTAGNGFFIDDDDDNSNMEFRLEAVAGNPYHWRLVEAASGKYLESIFGSLLLSQDNGKPSQTWRLELEEDGCYKIQNVSDSKVLSVSGSSQLAGTPVFMSAYGAAASQSFGLYFDARKHDYEAADMFSSAYRAANATAIEEQKTFEQSAGINTIDAVWTPEVSAVRGSNILEIRSAASCNASIKIIDTVSGRILSAVECEISAGRTSVALPEALPSGIYLVEISSSATQSVHKIII